MHLEMCNNSNKKAKYWPHLHFTAVYLTQRTYTTSNIINNINRNYKYSNATKAAVPLISNSTLQSTDNFCAVMNVYAFNAI